jgi:hypoxanthine phosphoribosyltransferase
LNAVRERLLALGALRVWLAVFAVKDTRHSKPVTADCSGITVPDRYVFGFGWMCMATGVTCRRFML